VALIAAAAAVIATLTRRQSGNMVAILEIAPSWACWHLRLDCNYNPMGCGSPDNARCLAGLLFRQVPHSSRAICKCLRQNNTFLLLLWRM